MEIKQFIDDTGKLTAYPAKFKKKFAALTYLAGKFEPGRQYTEQEVNFLLMDWHTFEDWAALRRDMFELGFLTRTRDGSLYWLNEKQPSPSDFGLD